MALKVTTNTPLYTNTYILTTLGKSGKLGKELLLSLKLVLPETLYRNTIVRGYNLTLTRPFYKGAYIIPLFRCSLPMIVKTRLIFVHLIQHEHSIARRFRSRVQRIL